MKIESDSNRVVRRTARPPARRVTVPRSVLGCFMKCTTDPVATDVLDSLAAVCLRSSLNCGADAIDGRASVSMLHGLLEGRASGMAQARLQWADREHTNRSSGNGEIAWHARQGPGAPAHRDNLRPLGGEIGASMLEPVAAGGISKAALQLGRGKSVVSRQRARLEADRARDSRESLATTCRHMTGRTRPSPKPVSQPLNRIAHPALFHGVPVTRA